MLSSFPNNGLVLAFSTLYLTKHLVHLWIICFVADSIQNEVSLTFYFPIINVFGWFVYQQLIGNVIGLADLARDAKSWPAVFKSPWTSKSKSCFTVVLFVTLLGNPIVLETGEFTHDPGHSVRAQVECCWILLHQPENYTQGWENLSFIVLSWHFKHFSINYRKSSVSNWLQLVGTTLTYLVILHQFKSDEKPVSPCQAIWRSINQSII